MNLENSKVILDSYRVIGIKDTDKEKLISATMKKESSFTPTDAVSEPMIQDQPIVEVVPEIMPEVTSNVTPEVTLVMPEVSSEPTFVQPVEPTLNEVPEVVHEVTPEVTNMFDAPVDSVNPVFPEQPVTAEAEVTVEPSVVNPVMGEDVQGGNAMTPELDTPQNFFDKVEQPANDTLESNASSYSEDPAIIMIDNIRKVVEDKNEMIKALNDKIDVLTEQVKNLEEARKVSEAQRVAAETTLAQVRSAEIPNGGPTLTYQQPAFQNQNYNQAA